MMAGSSAAVEAVGFCAFRRDNADSPSTMTASPRIDCDKRKEECWDMCFFLLARLLSAARTRRGSSTRSCVLLDKPCPGESVETDKYKTDQRYYEADAHRVLVRDVPHEWRANGSADDGHHDQR